jgi:hypothetical protein
MQALGIVSLIENQATDSKNDNTLANATGTGGETVAIRDEVYDCECVECECVDCNCDCYDCVSN